MSTRLEELTTRRRLLQARCAAQRGEIGVIEADLDAGVARVDRAVAVARRLGPFVLLAGVAVLVAIGPGRALGVVRQGLTVALFANRAARLLH